MTKPLEPQARLSKTAQAAVWHAVNGDFHTAYTLMQRLARRGTESGNLETIAVCRFLKSIKDQGGPRTDRSSSAVVSAEIDGFWESPVAVTTGLKSDTEAS